MYVTIEMFYDSIHYHLYILHDEFLNFMKSHQIVFGHNELNDVKMCVIGLVHKTADSKFQEHIFIFSESCQNIGS